MTRKFTRRETNFTLARALMLGTAGSAFGLPALAAQTFPVGTVYGKDHILSRMVVRFSELVDKHTDGQIKVVPRFGSPFGDVYQVSKQVANGQRKLDVVSMSSDVDPRLAIGYMGGLVTNYEQARKLYGPDGTFMALINEIGESVGYKYFGWAPTGFGGIAFRGDGPNTIPSPVKYKVRVAPYKGMIAAFEAYGFNAIPMPYSETYTALQTGAIDGKGACPPQEALEVFADVMKTYTYIRNYFEGIIGVAGNLKWFNGLPKEQQQALIEAGREATAYVWEDAQQVEETHLNGLKTKGIDVVEFSPEEYDKIKQITQHSEWPVLEEIVGKPIMDQIRAMAF